MMQQTQQQIYPSASPMAGQETFHAATQPQPTLAHTPTTSSMLAALQNDTFGAALDPTTAFAGDNYNSLSSYMDATGTSDDGLSVHQPPLSFTDFGASGAFDVSAFTPEDLGMSTAPTPAGGPDLGDVPGSSVDVDRSKVNASPV
jgi:regulatory factor X